MSVRADAGAGTATVARDVAAVLGFAALTALGSRAVVELPGIPAPLTLQVAPVLLGGLLLGWRRGAAAQLVFLATIACGLPLDARMRGLAAMAGPTAGYLVGFVLAAATAGALAGTGRSLPRLMLAAVGGLAAMYTCAGAWLAVLTGADLTTVWRLGVAPFVGVDLLKAVLATGAAAARSIGRR